MRRIVLVKHAAPLVVEGTPSEEWRLSEAGRSKAAELAERLRTYQLAVAVTSLEPKASETGRIIANAIGIPLETREGLQEHDRAGVPMMRSAEFISSMALFLRQRNRLVLGGETAEQVEARIVEAIDSVVNAHRSGNLLIVTHGTVLALFLATCTKEDAFALWRRMGLPSFVVLEEPGWKVVETVDRL